MTHSLKFLYPYACIRVLTESSGKDMAVESMLLQPDAMTVRRFFIQCLVTAGGGPKLEASLPSLLVKADAAMFASL